MIVEPPKPSPWETSIISTPASSNPRATLLTCAAVYWWLNAWLPSRQRTVQNMDESFFAHWIASAIYFFQLPACRCRPISSPTFTAAEVMISRLPAYFGRKSPAPSTSTKRVTFFLRSPFDRS